VANVSPYRCPFAKSELVSILSFRYYLKSWTNKQIATFLLIWTFTEPESRLQFIKSAGFWSDDLFSTTTCGCVTHVDCTELDTYTELTLKASSERTRCDGERTLSLQWLYALKFSQMFFSVIPILWMRWLGHVASMMVMWHACKS
jgi:hypothetical protein